MPAVEVVAVNQCSGNRRGLSKPHVAGVEWGYGAMGCARWKGARLKDMLDKVGVKKEAIEIGFNGADGPAIDKTPDFIKSIPVWKAMDADTIIAYEMNGAPLPHFNGFPARLIVPGWTGTYWMKHLTTINVLTKPQGGFWMKPAYRIPVGKFPVVARFITQEDATSTPITEIVVNSLITSHRDGAKVKRGKVTVSGLAWDGGYGIRAVQVSTDGGKTWTGCQARRGPRPLCVPAVELRAQCQARQEHGDGQRHQQNRPRPDRRPDLQSGRLSQQRHAKHHSDSLREGTMRTFVIAFIAALIALPAAAEQQINLKKAPGVDKVEANCQACHSLAYIPMNSPFLNAAGWTAEVNKMIKAMGAPIDDADAKAIIDYLAKNYGT